MSRIHTIALQCLHEAVCMVVRGFGSDEDEVQVAGDAERLSRAARRFGGVPVDAVTRQEILDAAARLGVGRDAAAAAAGV